jgi:DNA-binding response OmpR family regulator
VLLADADAPLKTLGMEVVYATTPDEAEQALRIGGFALVLVDFAEDPNVGFLTLERLRRIDDEAGIVLFTVNESAVATIAAMCDPPPDARDFWLPKPFDLEVSSFPCSFLPWC